MDNGLSQYIKDHLSKEPKLITEREYVDIAAKVAAKLCTLANEEYGEDMAAILAESWALFTAALGREIFES